MLLDGVTEVSLALLHSGLVIHQATLLLDNVPEVPYLPTAPAQVRQFNDVA